MSSLSFARRHPVFAYVLLCYLITWTVWFAIPLVSDGDWTVIKIFVGVGVGPGIAAVVLDRLRGTSGPVDARWWKLFALVAIPVGALGISNLLTGDGPTAEEYLAASPSPVDIVTVIGVLLSASICGFIFASAAVSRTPTLRSITDWRAKPRWWLVALLLPAALMLVGLAIAVVAGEASSSPRPEGLASASWLGYVARSFLFSLVVVGIGEETGWRGWMLPHLLQRWSPLLSSIVVGVVWGLWHFPLYVIGGYEGHPSAVLEYLGTGPLLATLFTWLWLRTNGNLLLAVVLHATMNNAARMLPVAPPFSAVLLAFIAVIVIMSRMWERRHPLPDAAPFPTAG